MAYDGYRSPRPDQGFSEYSYPQGVRTVDPRAATAYPTTAYPPPPTSGSYPDPRDPRDARDSRSYPRPRAPSAARDGYSSDSTRESAYQPRYTEHGSTALDQPPPEFTNRDYLAQLKAELKEEVMRDLKASGSFPADTGVPLARTQSHPAGPTFTPPSPRANPEYSTYGSPPTGTANYINPMQRSPRDSMVGRSDRGPPSPAVSDSNPVRPRPTRASTSQEPSPLDKTWGVLFDSVGRPTARLGQLLRGLANHIISDFEPRNSIVVTPVKMAAYYDMVKVQDEPCLWSYQFKGRKPRSLSRLYQELECEHHLVQDRLDEEPFIPGLTPVGFSTWMTALIRAYPDQEVERLQKAIKVLPISNADDAKERFPKECNRHMFPKTADQKCRERFERAVSNDDDADVPKVVEYGADYSHSRSETVPPLERERKPYYPRPSESAIDDMPPPPTPTNLERERKPYVAQPGGGKSHDSGKLDTGNRPVRSNSTSKVRPTNIVPPPTSHHRSGSTNVPNVNAAPRQRKRSPSFSYSGDPYRHSENDVSTYRDAPTSVEYDDEKVRYAREAEAYREEWLRRAADREAREFDSPKDREKYDREMDDLRAKFDRENISGLRRGYEEDYYRPSGRGGGSSGTTAYYDNPPYPSYSYR